MTGGMHAQRKRAPRQPSGIRSAKTAAALIGGLALSVGACGGDEGLAGPHEPPPSPKQVVEHLRLQGLPIKRTERFGRREHSSGLLGQPDERVAKANFVDGRVKRTGGRVPRIRDGGSIEVFDDRGAAERRVRYLSRTAGSGGAFAEYDPLSGSVVLLRVSRALAPEEAKEYERALSDL